jgi:hypothetical protein
VIRDDRPPGAELQQELRDLLCLAVAGDHLRWVVVGDDGELDRWLSDAVAHWRALGDGVAAHLVARGIPPDGRVRSLAQDVHLNWVPEGWVPAAEARLMLDQRLRTVAGWARLRAQTADPDSARVLGAVCESLRRAA